jgi:hypothetical protein
MYNLKFLHVYQIQNENTAAPFQNRVTDLKLIETEDRQSLKNSIAIPLG